MNFHVLFKQVKRQFHVYQSQCKTNVSRTPCKSKPFVYVLDRMQKVHFPYSRKVRRVRLMYTARCEPFLQRILSTHETNVSRTLLQSVLKTNCILIIATDLRVVLFGQGQSCLVYTPPNHLPRTCSNQSSSSIDDRKLEYL